MRLHSNGSFTAPASTPTPSGLPNVLPIFPLARVLLLPRGRLPLHIFEPRYLAMVEDAIKGDGLIGMVQPDCAAASRSDVPIVYSTGCAGCITEAHRTPDGRYLVTLTGVCRFETVEERPMMRGYRVVVPAWDRFAGDLETGLAIAPDDRVRLLSCLTSYLAVEGITVDWEVLRMTGDETLVNSLAMICPFEAREKQALLEAPGLAERARLLGSIMQMAIAGPCSGEYGRAH